MAIIKDGKVMNTEEDNKLNEEWLKRKPRVKIKIKETGEVFEVPSVVETPNEVWK